MTRLDTVYPFAAAIALGCAVACIARPRWASALQWVALLAMGFYVVYTAVGAFNWDGVGYRDFRCFWLAGTDVLAGREAYSASIGRTCPVYNPPTALPLFAAFAALPPASSYAVWTAVCGLLVIAMIPLSVRVLRAETSAALLGLDGSTILILTAALCLSNAARSNLINGQMGVPVAFAILTACWARNAARPLLAAAALTAATVKINLVLPFGLLFLGRQHRRTILWSAVSVIAVCLCTASITDQWQRVRTLADGIESSSSDGHVNDYSRANPASADILGLDKLLYHLGLADRSAIRLLQLTLLAALTVALTRTALSPRTSPGLVASMLALFAGIFLYHRNYDTVLLALPLTFAAGHARTSATAARWWMIASALCMLGMLYLPRKALFVLSQRTFSSPVLTFAVERLVLPSGTWLILIAMACLWMGSRRYEALRCPCTPSANSSIIF